MRTHFFTQQEKYTMKSGLCPTVIEKENLREKYCVIFFYLIQYKER